MTRIRKSRKLETKLQFFDWYKNNFEKAQMSYDTDLVKQFNVNRHTIRSWRKEVVDYLNHSNDL